MKKTLPIAIVLWLTACTKNMDAPASKDATVSEEKKKETCGFGINVFNKVKRAPSAHDLRGKPIPKGDVSGTVEAVILLDFDGHLVSNTSWNTNGDFYCGPSNLAIEEITKVLNRVTEDFRPFSVAVTTDEAIYLAANPYKRTRVVITESWEWFGQAGGTSYRGSFTWGDNTPCFVFNSLLGYDEKKVGEAASHEAGHTLGLRHQSSYDDACTNTSEYNFGGGAGVTGWAPIMGCGYNQNVTTWHNGPNPYGCTSLQDDLAVITSVITYRTDDHSNTTRNAIDLITNAEGVMNSSSDVDFFSISIDNDATVTITPFTLDGTSGANLDLQLKVYDRNGNLLRVVSDPQFLSASASLPAGRYYVSVETEENASASRYGMLGKYIISMN